MSHITTDVEKIQNAVSEMAGDLLKEGLTVVGPARRPVLQGLAAGPRLAVRHAAGLLPAGAPRPAPARLATRPRCGAGATSPRSCRRRSPGFRVVKAFGMEGFETARFRRAAAPALPREHAHHAHDRGPAAAHGGGGRPGPGGRALLRQPRDPRRAAHHRRVHVVPGRALRDVHADQAALPRERHPAGRAGRGQRASSRCSTRTRRSARRPGARALPRMQREIEYRDVGFRYADGDGARAAARDLHARAPARWWPSWARAGRARPRS